MICMVVWAITIVLGRTVAPYADNPLGATQLMVREIVAAALFIASGLVLWLCRRPSLDPRTLIRVGLAFEVWVGLGIGILENLRPYTSETNLISTSWISVWIVFFPMIVPTGLRRTALAAILTAAMPILVTACAPLVGRPPAPPFIYLVMGVNSVVAVGLALVGARIIYRLNRAVIDARELGSYRLKKRLGEGGMGEVWLGEHRLLARPAAVKMISAETLGRAQDYEAVKFRFEREAQVTASLRSPHTVELYDFGVTDDGRFFYVMELLSGLDLEALVARFGPLPAERVVHILLQVCHSLGEAHHQGLMHRDIKPANIFLCRYGRDYDFVKVLDFGLVKQQAGPKETLDGQLFGTPAYMSPEQVRGQGTPDYRADLYAVGCVAFWLLTGRLVFEGDSSVAIMVRHLNEPPPRPSEVGEAPIPKDLEDLIMWTLEKDP
ncbi:MAG: serine/threonine protein kinase, partial [Myxococcales bacterium]|nr:serine/threonine protein kinase [Myxococcales bacterium]